ncbi:Topoisom_bac domain-containing protein/zf-C4_Topoisom domain-containing protein/Toprim domain-containing protein [Cephalotus follicularis]|uniref:DNA topoisomerase n=1 Tax=Cephalotus follicularis TaxID=3775 RepID=A0A1Q3B7A1_CEPFO|nr:Topoisom_bac domain-containing protein/zf-C4_Topoisom domain-containing protein/Toprim domain-containing protein [Cephalotus follicularis]
MPQRSFFFLVNTCCSLLPASSSLRLRSFMAKLQCISLPGNLTPFPLCVDDRYRKWSQIRFRRILDVYLPLHYNSITKNSLFTHRAFLNNSLPLRSPKYLPFSKRYFSQSPRVGDDGRRTAALREFANHKTKAASNSDSKDTKIMASSCEQPLGGSKGSNSHPPASNTDQISKKKKQPRPKKKKKEQPSAATQKASIPKDSENDSQAEGFSTSKTYQSPTKVPEKNSTANTPVQVPDSSPSTKNQSDKKIGNSSRKGKSVKKSPQKPEPQDMSKLKIWGQQMLRPLYPPVGKSVVVVESATKAKVIQGYLGDMFEVVASHGHVRDLAARSGSVRPDDDFSMVWEVPSAAWTHLKSIKFALGGAKYLILASDPDREGEAIAWHIIEMLEQQDALHENLVVARVVFHEITEASIKNALQSPREIDENLVRAYLARRALDYLIGFNISPLLWRKLPGCRSAGRVQSAALSLISDREMEIDEFKPREYWTVEVELNKKGPSSSVNALSFTAHLTHLDSEKLNQFSIGSQREAKDVEQKIISENFHVVGSKRSKIRKNPPTPYITSTLQQDAAKKLNFSATHTMKLAQKLYEGVELSDGKSAGLITYIRTDGLHISNEAVGNILLLVTERYGPEFASKTVRKFFKKVKNAQEAHEAIRPTEIRRLPSMLAGKLDEDSLKLYTLIWSRTVACQMESATVEQIQLDVGNASESVLFRSSVSRINFRGYRAVYEDVEAEALRDKESEENDRDEAYGILNSLKPRDPLYLGEVELKEHHTQPPPRYSEGTLVKKLEELGIGRPSTYAPTIKVLQDRNYVTVKNRVLYPEFRGRMVSAFLSHHFSEVTDYSFTADMENELDNVSAGLTEWKGLLRDYWTRFSSYCHRTESVHIHQVEKMLEKTFGGFLFASFPDKSRTCPSCGEGTLIFKVSKVGAGYFVGCSQHPQCKYIAKTLYGADEEEEDNPQKNNVMNEPKVLGLHPSSDEKILLKSGPYGNYVQLGEDRSGYMPKRTSISHIKNVDSITLEDALELMKYPLTLGNHPKDNYPIIVKLSKVGFCVRHRRTIASVPKNVNPRDITIEKALELLSGKDVRLSGRPKNKPKVEGAFEAM